MLGWILNLGFAGGAVAEEVAPSPQSFAGIGPGIGGPRRVEPGAQRWEFQDPREIRVQAYRPQAPTPPRVDNKVGNFFAKPRTRKTRPLK